ncbi:MAG: glycosyltransferase family 4 protein [Gemmatimonadetes bacterium]|nr:glycosyltransferase family 4 protein [Gemmatimonadota bacterium]
MNVAHVVPALFGPDGVVGGAERYAFELARHMAAEVPTRLVTFGDNDRETELGALSVRVLGRPWHVRGQRANPFHLGVFRAIGDARIVHCHQQHVLITSAVALWCRLTGRRPFVTELGGGGWDVSAYVSTDRWFYGHLHLSEYSRRVFGHEGQPWARVISGGVDTGRFSPDPCEPRSRTPIFVGRMLPHKGLDDLIAALPCRMSLRLIGPLHDTGAIEALKAKAAGKAVTFCHDLDDTALVTEYRRALCLVLPSVYRTAGGADTRVPELLGQTLLEAMACATPVICTNVASMPEIVEHGVTGLVVPPNDPVTLGRRLQWLADHPDAAAEMGAAGRRRVLEAFQWPHVVRRCLAAYAGR